MLGGLGVAVAVAVAIAVAVAVAASFWLKIWKLNMSMIHDTSYQIFILYPLPLYPSPSPTGSR